MTIKVLGGLGAILVFLAAGWWIVHWLRPRVVVEGPAADAPRTSLETVDHAAFDALLQKYVDDNGLVAYARWKAAPDDVQTLDRYLAALGAVDLAQPAARGAELAYWINAYNALTLKGILREYPTSSIRNHTSSIGGYNVWTDLLIPIAGRNYSLDNIEHEVLRARMREPRIHFALVCASKGCPPLRNHVYTAADIEQQLNDNARRFLGRPTNFRADPASRTVYVSELFSWYGTDFAPTPAEQMHILRAYVPDGAKLAWIEEANVTVKYLDYDWSLNDQAPATR